MLYDPANNGYEAHAGSGKFRGVQVPIRGNAVFLSEAEALLSITGPQRLKKKIMAHLLHSTSSLIRRQLFVIFDT